MTPVTVIGLGPMGQAMAGALLRAGHPVTVWNRTPGRADELVRAGAVRAGTVAAAIAASPLTILSLTDYQVMYDIVPPDALSGRDLVNLSSDTPDAARDAAGWAAGHGGRFLTGGVMVPAPMIDTPAAYAYYSGPPEVFAAHEPVLRLIGEPRHLGADPGLAQLFYQANLEVFLTTLSSLLHATALVTASGVPAREFLPDVMRLLTGIPAMVGDGAELAAALEAGKHPGDLSTVTMMGATADHILRTTDSLGIDRELPAAVRSHYQRAIEAGHGSSNWTALFEVMPGVRQ
ncbi:NAD(P)-dependent oxidoreductase [Actinoplanes couchii]|uniref:Dehydrogenase n=1 Tax=Actinoplanes couchii TaxID=403638 RepID=A0ABQ3XTY9_9ACTN|nr:NAD(P)-binding domain-containing protein [Actinoplanes couchii]MDR6318002.1 3-hydroxyisobutyrate dehydrogenase-like beta-hydroxyacid dehydrogenase [Actinoplanes couchii]GID61890.1 dehydrogenase [Actinoplanes couchii]